MMRDYQLKAMFLIGSLRNQPGLSSAVRAILLPPAGANARHLVSRNKREGEYMGRGHYDKNTGTYMGKLSHQRTGPGPLPPGMLSLKRDAIVWGRL